MAVNAEPNRLDIHVHVPSGTIIRVLLTILVTWAVLRLWPEFIFLQGEKHPWESPSGTIQSPWKPGGKPPAEKAAPAPRVRKEKDV